MNQLVIGIGFVRDWSIQRHLHSYWLQFFAQVSQPLSAGVITYDLIKQCSCVVVTFFFFIFKPAQQAPAPGSPAGCPNDPQCKVKVSQVCSKLGKRFCP